MKLPLVSVIVTTRNSAQTLSELLRSIVAQTYKKCEIVVVDNSSRDETAKIAKKYTRYVYQKGPERSAQRNFAIKKSRGKYCLILDSDMVLTKNVVKECLQIFSNSANSQNIGGIIIPEVSFGEGFWSKAKILERAINQGEDYFDAARFFPKKIIADLGGYDQNLTGTEDWDLPQRIAVKYQITRVKSLIYHNEGRVNLLNLAKKKYYYAKTVKRYLAKQHISAISPRTIYFLRPAFYKKWRLLIKDPVTSVAMVMMLTVELIYGGLGYLKGIIKND